MVDIVKGITFENKLVAGMKKPENQLLDKDQRHNSLKFATYPKLIVGETIVLKRYIYTRAFI